MDPSGFKVRPNLFIVGVGKAGTHTLYAYLGQHPDVFMSPKKEPNFFGADLQFRAPRIREDQYLALFADAADKKYRGEASVSYLLSGTAAAEIRAYAPEARIVIVVRNPIEVMQARHAQNLITGVENIDRLERALAAEAERRRGKRVPKEAGVVDWLFYREWVNFTDQIKRYQRAFPKEQIFLGIYDDLRRDPASFYQSVLEFLQLPGHAPARLAHVNPRRRIRSHTLHRLLMSKTSMTTRLARTLMPSPLVRGAIASALMKANIEPETQKAMPIALKRKLQSELAGEVRTLGELLGRDLSHWLDAAPATGAQRPDPL